METSHHKRMRYMPSFISGGVAGIVGKTVIAPFDRIKILFQVTAKPFTFKDGWREAANIYKREGMRGLWRGNLISLIQVFPYTAIQFASFDFFHNIFADYSHTYNQKHFYNFVAGSLAGMCATIATYPTEFIRTRMGMQRDKIIYNSLTDAVRKIYAKEGFLAFYRGIIPSFMGVIPYKGTGFLMFYLCKDKMKQAFPKLPQNRVFDFVFGALSGLVSQMVSYPFDTVRKKMQAESVLLEQRQITHKKGAIGWGRHILNTEGVPGLFKGVTVNMIKGPIACGICFTVKNLLHKRMDKTFVV